MSETIKKYSKVASVLGLILAIVAMYGLIPLAKAATVTSRKATLTDSRPSQPSNWTIQFVTPTGVDATTDTIIIKFDDVGDAFNLTGIVYTDIDLAEDTTAPINDCSGFTDEVLVATDTVATNEWIPTINTTTDEISFQPAAANDTGALIAAGACVQIEIGTNAAGPGVNQIDNPAKVAAVGTADIYDVDVAGTFGDTGKMKVAIQDGVTVKATITESLSFIISTVAAGSCLTDTGSPTVVGTTLANEVDFGTVAANAFKAACHNLSVSTNADGGYVLTTQETTSMKYGATVLNDTTCDGGACSESAYDDWATASANWGLGHTCTDVSGEGTDCNDVYTAVGGDCATPPCYRQFACVGADADCEPGSGGETAQTFMSNNDPVDTNQCQIHYKISRSSVQTAGLYQNTIVYIATATY